jgi:hypothetical protein
LAVVLVLLLSAVAALNTKVDPLSEWCFIEPVGRDIPATFQFRVTHGGKLDIDATLYDESGRALESWKSQSEGHHQVKGDAVNSKFKVCFSNSMARFTPKWVSFYFHHGQHPAAARKEHLDPIESQIRVLSRRIDDLQNAQVRLRNAEKNHRATVEDANERILLWSVFEVVALFGMGIFQIYFLKRFLERKTTI